MLSLHLNESPYRVPAHILSRVLRPEDLALNRYPPRGAPRLRGLYAAYAGVRPEQVAAFNGGDEAINMTVLALRPSVRRVVVMPPTFPEYSRAAALAGLEVVRVPLEVEGNAFRADTQALLREASRDPSLVFACLPNNPTGNRVLSEEDLGRLLTVRPRPWVVVDEAYWEFAGGTVVHLLERHPNLIILRTMSKAFCLAGLRVGFALASPEVVERLDETRQPFNIGALAELVGSAVLTDPSYVKDVVVRTVEGRRRLSEGLAALPGVTPLPSLTNFVLCRVPHPAAEVEAAMRDEGVRVRHYPREPALARHIRITVGTVRDIDRCLEALRRCLDVRA